MARRFDTFITSAISRSTTGLSTSRLRGIDPRASWKQGQAWVSKRSRSLVSQIILISAVLVINISLTIYANFRYPSVEAVGLLYKGECDTVHKLNMWLHFLISVLSTLMLSASNFCMQVQSAPTRADIDKAHENGTWLDIGLHSPRNLSYIQGWKRVSWAILGITSLPINMLCESPINSNYHICTESDTRLLLQL